jgi:hypothetical protein
MEIVTLDIMIDSCTYIYIYIYKFQSLILFATQIDFLPMTTVCGTGETYVFAGKNKL